MVKEMKLNQEPGALVQARLSPSLLDSAQPCARTPHGLRSLRGIARLGQCIWVSSVAEAFQAASYVEGISEDWAGRVASSFLPGVLGGPFLQSGVWRSSLEAVAWRLRTLEPWQSLSFPQHWDRFLDRLRRQSPLFTESQFCHLAAAPSGPWPLFLPHPYPFCPQTKGGSADLHRKWLDSHPGSVRAVG